jgi:hypothetical protein
MRASTCAPHGTVCRTHCPPRDSHWSSRRRWQMCTPASAKVTAPVCADCSGTGADASAHGPGLAAEASLDLFRGLVPLAVHEASSLYSERKAALVRAAAEAGDTLDTSLASLLDTTKLRALMDQVGPFPSRPSRRVFSITRTQSASAQARAGTAAGPPAALVAQGTPSWASCRRGAWDWH